MFFWLFFLSVIQYGAIKFFDYNSIDDIVVATVHRGIINEDSKVRLFYCARL